jgi:NAD(P)-dependent dehydrogenase (short-subunit alcohol dehydrogenase family)
MNISMSGKTVFVTGAASGLGRATALEFARAGAFVGLMDLDAARLQDTRAQVEELGARCITHAADVSRKANCEAAIAAAIGAFGKLDVLCNVAGIVGFYHATEVSEAAWEKCLAVNLSGPFYLCQAAIPHLLKSSGNIVNVASAAALKGQAFTVPYATSKAALVNMTRSLAMEFMHKPIRINAVLPGAMNTAMAHSVRMPEDIDMSLCQRYFNMRPASDPADVARFIVYVASDQSLSLHGACLSIDTGASAG